MGLFLNLPQLISSSPFVIPHTVVNGRENQRISRQRKVEKLTRKPKVFPSPADGVY